MSEEKKKYLKEKYYKNHTQFYDSENIFKNENHAKIQQISNNTEITEYKESIIIKIINKIKNCF